MSNATVITCGAVPYSRGEVCSAGAGAWGLVAQFPAPLEAQALRA